MEDYMDQTTLISMAVFIFTNIGTIISMFLWLRSEANADRRESLDMIEAIRQDIKDFHGRLCAIEENKKR
jgi:hypothetical protein